MDGRIDYPDCDDGSPTTVDPVVAGSSPVGLAELREVISEVRAMAIRTGIFWYRSAEDYADMLAVFADSDELPDSYADWLAQAKHAEQVVLSQGDIAVRAYVEPGNFAEWCVAHDTHVNAQGRVLYGSWYAAREVFWDALE